MTLLTTQQVAVLKQALITHYRRDITSCACGWAELGRSHPDHVINVVQELLLALDGPTARPPPATTKETGTP